VNLPDGRVELFDLRGSDPVSIDAIAVGLDPVTARFRTSNELWVVNLISDSISIIDLSLRRVVATLQTKDEPCDVVFAGSPELAYVSCSQVNRIMVFDPVTRLVQESDEIEIVAEDPRSMAVSLDGSKVYVAIFESGNHSTILGGGSTMGGGSPPNVISDPAGPYSGQNPPPNDGVGFNPLINPLLPPPPPVGLIVRQDASGDWMDDNNGNWTQWVSGPSANASGRPVNWELLDRDIAVIDTSNGSVSYIEGLMNICMSVAVNPASGAITLVGTEATNEIRFEPVLKGKFIRVQMASVDTNLSGKAIVDLNAEHLDYTAATIAHPERNKSLGDPRGIAWNQAGTRGYVTGMGSNNLIIIDPNGLRAGVRRIELGEGPTSLAMDDSRDRLYVLSRFAGILSVVDTVAETVHQMLPLHDPTTVAIKQGRRHLYDTHRGSGLGQIACASCHVDARMDRLSWDLGDPSGEMKLVEEITGIAPLTGKHNPTSGLPVGAFPDFHPMKGPMLTQTLMDIIGHEPFHWRGDRDGLEEFAGAFVGLQGDDQEPSPVEMQEFEDMLDNITLPPNPVRNFNNTLPVTVDMTGHFATGRHALSAGTPLPAGNAQAGLNQFRTTPLDGGTVTCVSCHSLPTGKGTHTFLVGATFTPIPAGPLGERHLSLVNVDGSTNVTQTIAGLRNVFERTGFDYTQTVNRAGFGYLHDGSVASLAQFVDEPVFATTSDQQVADLIAFMLAFSGSDLPEGSPNLLDAEPPGPPSQDSHAAVGKQVTIANGLDIPLFDQVDVIDTMISLADADPGRVDLVVKGGAGPIVRGWFYDRGANVFQTDSAGESVDVDNLRSSAAADAELTYTVVPRGTGERIGIDRDEDGALDYDQAIAGTHWVCDGQLLGDATGDGQVNLLDFAMIDACWLSHFVDDNYHCALDFDRNGVIDSLDLIILFSHWLDNGLPLCGNTDCPI
jgi:YVTN family beta-propeller protein